MKLRQTIFLHFHVIWRCNENYFVTSVLIPFYSMERSWSWKISKPGINFPACVTKKESTLHFFVLVFKAKDICKKFHFVYISAYRYGLIIQFTKASKEFFSLLQNIWKYNISQLKQGSSFQSSCYFQYFYIFATNILHNLLMLWSSLLC